MQMATACNDSSRSDKSRLLLCDGMGYASANTLLVRMFVCPFVLKCVASIECALCPPVLYFLFIANRFHPCCAMPGPQIPQAGCQQPLASPWKLRGPPLPVLRACSKSSLSVSTPILQKSQISLFVTCLMIFMFYFTTFTQNAPMPCKTLMDFKQE